MTAAALGRLLPKTLQISLLESEQIGTIGVGESTIPPLQTFHQYIGVDEREFVKATDATFKLGIDFQNWKNDNSRYFHSFGWTGQDTWAYGFQHYWLKANQQGHSTSYSDYCLELQAAYQNKFAINPKDKLNYAYHIDSARYSYFLRKRAEKDGVKRIEGIAKKVNLDANSGAIASLLCANGVTIQADFFIDCTGFRALLMRQSLNVNYEDWSHWLPCDRAIPMQTTATATIVPYTRARTHSAGWMWRIPLQTRVGNGIVYSSAHLTDDLAKQILLQNIAGEVVLSPKPIKFQTGQLQHYWYKNCVAIGLASGFIEPLESTSIHLIQKGITRLIQMFPTYKNNDSNALEYNRQMRQECEHIRDFIILHYHLNDKKDSVFWQDLATMAIPNSLQQRIDLFKHNAMVFDQYFDLFAQNSWVQVMLGQGLSPNSYHPIVDHLSHSELQQLLAKHQQQVKFKVQSLPKHSDFIQFYCQ